MTYPGQSPYLPPPLPERRIHPALIGAVAVLVLVVGGLAAWLFVGRGDDGATAAPATSTSTATAPAKSKTPSGPALGARTTGLKLGAKVTIPASADLSSATVQVIAYKRDTSSGEPLDAVQLRVCLGKERDAETTVSGGPWSLIYNAGESQHNEVSDGGPAPAWPTFDERKIRPGDCVKGWLAFTDAPGEPDGVAYKPASGFTANWSLDEA